MQRLDAEQVTFFHDAEGSLCVALAGQPPCRGVRCVALFPITEPTRHISLQAPEAESGEPWRELGVIADLTRLPQAQQRLVQEDMLQRWFVPEITDIVKIHKKHGSETWQVHTDRGRHSFTVTDKHENITMTDKGVVFITDADHFRYKISRHQTLPARARSLLEKVLL